MNLVLPDLTGTLGISSDESSWILTVYSSALFFGIPLSVWMASHFGYRRFLLASVAVFAIASGGCALAPDLSSMLIFRGIQGLAGGALVVWWRASVYTIFPKAERSGSLMQISTMLYFSSAAGLLLSGVLTEYYSWRLIFLPIFLFAAGATWLLVTYFPEIPQPVSSRVQKTDWLGIGLLATALICLQIAVNRGAVDGWWTSETIRLLVGASLFSFLLFLVWELSPLNSAPIMWLGLLTDRRVLSSALIGLLMGIILSGSLFVLPEFLRNLSIHTHSASQTGQLVSVYALTAGAIRFLIVPLIAWLGQRKVIAMALLLLIGSMLLFHRILTTDTPDRDYVMPLVLYGLCVALLLPAVGSGTVARIEQPKLLDGVSIYMTFRQLGASLGVAILTILLSHRETLHSAHLFEALGQRRETTHQWLDHLSAVLPQQGGLSSFASVGASLTIAVDAARRQAATLSYADAFAFMAVVACVALVLIPVIPPTPPIAKPAPVSPKS